MRPGVSFRIRVDPQDGDDLCVQTCLFFGFTPGGVFYRLPILYVAAWKRPDGVKIFVPWFYQVYIAFLVADYHVHDQIWGPMRALHERLVQRPHLNVTSRGEEL